MSIVQKTNMSDLLENLRRARISIACILDYLGEMGRRGDSSLAKLIRKLSSTYNLSLPDEKKMNKNNIKTSGYTTKGNKEFVMYVTDAVIKFMSKCGVAVGGDIRLIRNSLEKYIDHQHYLLNKSRKDTNAHQLSPNTSK
ncbi:MAG: hypothetical protein RBR34_07555 [Rhodospirillaceae bacterium]|nr:hypothetical protein [Rhodospirillaceae bacterium]